MYWFIPISSYEPMIWSEERIQITEEIARQILDVARTIHPKWVMLVKLSAIISDDDDDEMQCGIGSESTWRGVVDQLSGSEPMEWSENSRLRLSHCGHSFFDAMLSIREISELQSTPMIQTKMQSSNIGNGWMKTIMTWNQRGHVVFILKEG